METLVQEEMFRTTFSPGFLEAYAGRIISDPKIAIVELVANAWDAGATRVDITWPDNPDGIFCIEDNGCGMTEKEFSDRWPQLSYDRLRLQGVDVSFPLGALSRPRKAFGRNGKGRNAMFCFADHYSIAFCTEDGKHSQFIVERLFDPGPRPTRITRDDHVSKITNGVKLWAELVPNQKYLIVPVVRDLIGSKFVADPSFEIFVNEEHLQLQDLTHRVNTVTIPIPEVGEVLIHLIDSGDVGRTSRQHGVAWWVNKRLVGEATWKDFEAAWLDARSSEAKRYTFIVEADVLAESVEPDWTWFQNSYQFERVYSVVKGHIHERIQELFKSTRKSKKVAALRSNIESLRNLPQLSRTQLGHFLDELLERCPSLGEKELSAALEVLSNLERSRSTYDLLYRLSQLDPDDLDRLNDILNEWSVREAQLVLDELNKRLKLIEELEKRVENPASNELHDIQPLFEKGLWIFGPEYESIEFLSNRSLATVIREFFNAQGATISTPRRRPDFVALSDSSVGIYARDGYDKNSEVGSYGKILIIELKRGGFGITRKEKQQAQDYANALRDSGKVQPDTEIVAFVLGTNILSNAAVPIEEGKTTIHARAYSVVLRQAHARTFHLKKRIEDVRQVQETIDDEVEAVLNGTLI